MPLAILVLAFSTAIGAIIDFLVGEKGDKGLKKRLGEFFDQVGYGDWTALYKYPAEGLLRFMTHVLGDNPLSLRYLMRTAMLSLSMSALFFCLAMIWTYVHVGLTEKTCTVPGVSQFLEIPQFMTQFLIGMALFNIAFDYISWTATRWGLKAILAGRGISSALTLLFFPVLAVGILWLMYALYVPLLIKVQAEAFGIPFGGSQFAQIYRANFQNVAGLFTSPKYSFIINCPAKPGGLLPGGEALDHSIFSISFLNTMQIVATETMLPIVLLIASCAFGVLMYSTRPVTKGSLELILDRLYESPKHLFATLGTGLAGIAVLIKAVIDYRKS